MCPSNRASIEDCQGQDFWSRVMCQRKPVVPRSFWRQEILTEAQQNRGLKNASSRRISQPLSHQARGTSPLLVLLLLWERAERGSTPLNIITESDDKTSFENSCFIPLFTTSFWSSHCSSRLVSADPYFTMLPLTI